jgi:hypothetical protein
VQVPAAYDEQYEVLVSSLPAQLERAGRDRRIRETRRAILRVGIFGSRWPSRRSSSGAAASFLVAMALALSAYVVALSVTSWSIDDLAKVAVNRLLLRFSFPGLDPQRFGS